MTEHIAVFNARFNAKYAGTCTLDTCDKRRVIEIGDVCEYVDDEIFHLSCAGRVRRAEKLCADCYCYHAGEC